MPAQSTYTLIQSLSGDSGATITFTSIPQTYTDLVCVFSCVGNPNNTSQMSVFYTTNGGQTYMFGTGSGAASTGGSSTSAYIYLAGNGINLSSTNPYSGVIHINNYSNPNVFKSFIGKAGQNINGSGGIMNFVASSNTTSGITSFGISTNSGAVSFGANSKISLFGITAA